MHVMKVKYYSYTININMLSVACLMSLHDLI